MNKQLVDSLLFPAAEKLEKYDIVQNGKISKTFRGQISTFGAAVSMGSLLSAVAFFSAKGGASVDRQNLMKAINHLLIQEFEYEEREVLMDTLRNAKSKSPQQKKQDVVHCAIALKLAMNLYDLSVDKQENPQQGEEKV